MSYTRVCHICSYSCLCVGNFYINSNGYSHSISHKNVLKLCLMLWTSQEACSARLLNHFRDSTRMKQTVLMTSEWFCNIHNPKDIDTGVFGNHPYSHTSSEVQCVLLGDALSFYAAVRPYKKLSAIVLIF